MRTTAILAASAAVLARTSAHMFISSPTPIPGTDSKSPLDPSGSQFPCQGGSLPISGGQAMAAGSEQKLAFNLGDGENTAVHGGGSCQISITYETDPAKQKDPANWKVIYSIEGGCPTDAPGNLESGKVVDCSPSGGDTACVNVFPFTVPKGVKEGHAIMAWTWFNNIGNREMYMNCVNVNFTGGDGSEMESFPELFVANQQGIGECPTTERYNVKFPDPGKYVTTKTAGGAYPLAVPTGPGCSGGDSGGSNSSPPSYNPASTSPVQSPAQTTATQMSTSAVPTAAAPTSPLASLSQPSPASPLPATTQIAILSPEPQPSSTTTLVPETTPSTSGNVCSGSTVPCPTPGQLICIDTAHFGLCNIDYCAVPQDVASGTQCVDGRISRLQKKSKRWHSSPHRYHRHGRMRLH